MGIKNLINYSLLWLSMVTSIQISERLQDELARKKVFSRETYEDVIWNLIEDTKEINKETKAEIEEARAEIKKGKFHKLSAVKKELGL